MIDGLKNVMTPKPESSESHSNDSVESVALAGAVAIQRLIADRDSFRNRTGVCGAVVGPIFDLISSERSRGRRLSEERAIEDWARIRRAFD